MKALTLMMDAPRGFTNDIERTENWTSLEHGKSRLDLYYKIIYTDYVMHAI